MEKTLTKYLIQQGYRMELGYYVLLNHSFVIPCTLTFHRWYWSVPQQPTGRDSRLKLLTFSNTAGA